MSEFILYDAANSPCGRRVRMTLLEKGQPFEIRWLNLGLMDQKQAWYLKLNPNGLVPTLLHGEKVLFESNVINEYLDAVLPSPKLIPDSADLQAQMRMWMAYELEWAKPFREAIYQTYGKSRLRQTGISEEKLASEVKKRTSNTVYEKMAIKNLREEKNETLLDTSIAILMERIGWMEEQLKDERLWLLGDQFSLADIALAPRLDLFSLIEVSDFYQRFPKIEQYMDRIKNRDSWQRSGVLPDSDLRRVMIE
ncbi:MAG: glutathione S-transferase [Gammaproteobacteria bacterium]|jgi:glutathione S-transferase